MAAGKKAADVEVDEVDALTGNTTDADPGDESPASPPAAEPEAKPVSEADELRARLEAAYERIATLGNQIGELEDLVIDARAARKASPEADKAEIANSPEARARALIERLKQGVTPEIEGKSLAELAAMKFKGRVLTSEGWYVGATE
jgi:hypothetical protein